MDQTNNSRICKKHKNSTLEFLQVKNVNQTTDKSLFYCSSCINQDLSFQGVDHILIHQIANEGDTHIIQKWPPIQNQQIIEQLIQEVANSQSHSTAEQTITNFFSILKNEISTHIDTCQKKMVNLIKHQSFDGESTLKEYQAISQICELRKLLLSGNQADLYAKEASCREFLRSVEEKNDENTQKLENLLNKSQRKQSTLSFELPNQIKQSILTFIDSINFFNTDQNNNNLSGNNQSNLQNEQDSITDKIMKLISNKSNFCSDEFLKEIRMKFSQINYLLSSLSFQNQFQRDKKPVQFEEITNQQLDMIDVHVKHLSNLNKNQEYLGQLKNSKQVKSLVSVLNIKTNFMEKKFINDFEGYLIETYPYLRCLDFEKMITEVDRFNKMKSISEEAIQNILNPSGSINNYILVAPIQQNVIINFNSLQQDKQQSFQYDFMREEVCKRNLLKIIQSNILIKQVEKIDIMPLLQLEKGKFNNGQDHLAIKKQNNQIEIQNTQNKSWKNCISNIILEKDKKYVFRFQILKLDQDDKYFMMGLIKAEDVDSSVGYSNNLSCYLQQQLNQYEVKFAGNKGIYKNISGNELKINPSNSEEIELRVSLQEQVLEVLDYPNYTFRYGVEDKYRLNLINFKDLKLYLSQYHTNQKIILKSAFIVKSW